jgi:hypothetical protein
MNVNRATSRPSSFSPSGPGSFPFPLPPTFPPGVNPETYKIDEVTSLLNRAAFFSLFSIPSSNRPNNPFPFQLPFPLSILNRLPFFANAWAEAQTAVNNAVFRRGAAQNTEASPSTGAKQGPSDEEQGWGPVPPVER